VKFATMAQLSKEDIAQRVKLFVKCVRERLMDMSLRFFGGK
jgi:hypothetical protein